MNTWLNKVTKFQDKEISFGYLILLKTRELAQFLTYVKTSFNLLTSKLNVKRRDTFDVRKTILKISFNDWQKRGYSKGTLYYMKKNAAGNKPFTLNKHVRERLDQWEIRS